MRRFGLSNLDALLSLLLVELTWWGLVFFGQFLWYLFIKVGVYVETTVEVGNATNFDAEKMHNAEGDVFVTHILPNYLRNPEILDKEWEELILLLIFGALLFLRLKAPFLLLVTVLKNKVNEHCQLLRIWYWMTVLLDILLVVYVLFLAGMSGGLGQILETAVDRVVLFVIFRLIFWSVAKTVVAELSVKESSLFPVVGPKGVFLYLASNVKNAIGMLLTWEILINSLHLLSSVIFYLHSTLPEDIGLFTYYWAVLLPNPHTSSTGFASYGFYFGWICFGLMVHMVLIVLPSLQLAAVSKDKRGLLKVLIVLYILFGLGGYVAYNVFTFIDIFDFVLKMANEQPEMAVTYFTAFGASILMEFGQILLRLFLIEFLMQFVLHEPEVDDDGTEAGKERKALLQPFLGKELVPEGDDTE